MMANPPQRRAFVTGAAGFIGMHLCDALEAAGWTVVGADIHRNPRRPDIHQVDLRQAEWCVQLAKGCDVIFHLAADMGGMGFIGNEVNNAAIVKSNLGLTLAVAEAAQASGAIVVYTSSACVYPEDLQKEAECAPLHENDAGIPPPDAYGWEKLAGERVLKHALPPNRLRIARLHNVFGPHCTWFGGREKAPAALLRKALALTFSPSATSGAGDKESTSRSVEVWGDGKQTRTFLYVDDCVRALMALATMTPPSSTLDAAPRTTAGTTTTTTTAATTTLTATAPAPDSATATEDDYSGSGHGGERGSAAQPTVVNVGSDHIISINDFAALAVSVAHATAAEDADGRGSDGSDVVIEHAEGPQGVSGRNCDASRALRLLNWEPQVTLEEGMRRTAKWMRQEMKAVLASIASTTHCGDADDVRDGATAKAGSNEPAADEPADAAAVADADVADADVAAAAERAALLAAWRSSQLSITTEAATVTTPTVGEDAVHRVAEERTSFGLLLPVTSRGYDENKPEVFWDRVLGTLSQLGTSVRGDPLWPTMRIVLGLDDDDALLGEHCPGRERLVSYLQQNVCWRGGAGSAASVTVLSLSRYKRGAICQYWDALARRARELGCTHYILLGDDVDVKSPGWMTAIANAFSDIAQRTGLPLGFGCVAFTDANFPGFPTFPVVSHVHLSILGGRLVPKSGHFVNQDADPFLFQLYRRWGASTMLSQARLVNTIGGERPGRYDKQHTRWTGPVLTQTVRDIEVWLQQQGPRTAAAAKRARKLVIDIVVPTYRCNLEQLRPILHLEAPPDVSLGYIVVVDRSRDDPDAAACLQALENKFEYDWRYRIRCQEGNTGAPEARNRGVFESAAEFLLFLDDDVVPSRDIVAAYAAAVRRNPNGNGFAGPTFFPPMNTARTLGARLAGVTHFWDRAAKEDVMPWAVTANVLLRRTEDLVFDTRFPRTGGGEDIDVCLKVADGRLISVPDATAVHPWWNNGAPHLSRFWGWAKGDGALVHMFPQHTYLNLPNASEAIVLLLFFACCAHVASAIFNAVPSFGNTAHDDSSGIDVLRDSAQWLASSMFTLHHVLAVLISIFAGELLAEGLTHLLIEPDEYKQEGTSFLGRVAAVPHALCVRFASEAGRVYGHFLYGRFNAVCLRFDWFIGLLPTLMAHERKVAFFRATCWCAVAFIILHLLP